MEDEGSQPSSLLGELGSGRAQIRTSVTSDKGESSVWLKSGDAGSLAVEVGRL